VETRFPHKRSRRAISLLFLAMAFLFQTIVLPAQAEALFALTVDNGTGSGLYPEGARVPLSANPYDDGNPDRKGLEPADATAPVRIFDHWVGDIQHLDNPTASDTWGTMPAADISVTATYKDAPRWIPPTVVSIFPPNHVGTIFMFHGAGGCAQCFFVQNETRRFISDAISRSFAVVALDSADRENAHWDGTADYNLAPDPATNRDMQRVVELRDHLIGEGRMTAGDPVYLLGVSNGGVFASLFTEEVQAELHFPVAALALYISAGNLFTMPSTTVPTIFVLAENDSAPDWTGTNNPAALNHFDDLLARGIPTQLYVNTERPVNADSFWRIEGVCQAGSHAIYQALVDGGVIGPDGFLVENPSTGRWATKLPDEFQAFQTGVESVLWLLYAEHQFHNVFDDKVFTFLPNPQTVVDQLPVITDFTPVSGKPGATVNVLGQYFVGVQSVRVNGLAAQIFSSNTDSIWIQVPAAATTGPIEVTTLAGTVASDQSFMVDSLPMVTSFSPASGYPSDVVTVVGQNFLDGVTASIDGVSADIVYANANQVRIVVPSAATSGPIQISSGSGIAVSATDFTVLHQVPAIASFSPTRAVPGKVVTIQGTNLADTQGVSFGGVPVTEIVGASATTIWAKVPVGAVTGPIEVYNAWGSDVSVSQFEVLELPTIASFTPTKGPVGTVVDVLGSNFKYVQSATLGTTAASYTVVSDSLIKVTVPTTSAQYGVIKVVTEGGTVGTPTAFIIQQ
jgi:hypothetical protein